MPTMNIYGSKQILLKLDKETQNNLKNMVGQQLNCKEIQLEREWISVRLVENFSPEGMITPLECDINLNHSPKCIEKAYEICGAVRGYLLGVFDGMEDIKVRLNFSEFGCDQQ